MGITCLPVELFRLIIEGLASQADLYSLLLVSRRFRYEAERLLYCKITLERKGYNARLSLFQHLVDCPRVAVLVKVLSIPYFVPPIPPPPPTLTVQYQPIYIPLYPPRPSPFYSPFQPPLPQPVPFALPPPPPPLPRPRDRDSHVSLYQVALQKALRSVTNLKILSLALEFNSFLLDGDNRSISVLSGCTFRLQSLTISGVLEIDRTDIENQKEVEYLDIHSQNISFSQSSFEKLSVVSIDRFKLCGRPIKALKTSYFNEENTPQRLWTQASGSPYRSVMSLCLRAPYALPDITPHFPSLRYFYLHVSTRSLTELQPLLRSLKSLTQLRRVDIAGPFGIHGIAHFPPNIPDIFSEVATLERVIIDDYYRKCIREWIRGAEDHITLLQFDPEELMRLDSGELRRRKLEVLDPEEWKNSRWLTN